ncbi:MAG: glucosaminidase domain-containing protein [Terasakiella sp.]|uniref:glucosaminidase domain-containing protein n=1 Tax=unclassified Terasakiella TaxID=2614952 RepID=UPI003B00E4D8
MADMKESKGFQWTVLTLMGFSLALLIALQISAPTNTTSKAPKAVLKLPTEVAKLPASKEDLKPIKLEKSSKSLSVNELTTAFDKIGYRLKNIREGDGSVPRLFLASLPHDLATVTQTDERKALFFKALLPLILKNNEEILAERARVLRLHHRMNLGLDVIAQEKIWLKATFERYKVRGQKFDQLLKKIDIVPPSLALAQAAEESGWGTSRFVREGNALFGQWTFNQNDDGIVPAQRGDDQTHRIKAFDSIKDSLRAYMHNLNTHTAYKSLRAKRAFMRRTRQPIKGSTLATALDKYSERGEQYILSLKTIMDKNNLPLYDTVTLSDKIMLASAEPTI